VHRLSILRPDGWQGNIELAAIDLAARRHGLFHAPPDPLAPRWNYERRPDGIATLDMPDWETWTSKWDWQSWLADRLNDAQSAQGLIIDLRRNEGGNNCGDPILARLTDRELPGWSVDPRVRFREVSQNLSQHAETWDDSFRRLGANAQSMGEGWYRLADQVKETGIAPAPQQLRNPVAVLIGPANSSATFAFANAARATARVRLFGEPTGGNRRGINGGAFLFVTLPYSGIEFDLPLIGYFPLDPQPDEGILPDVTVTATAQSIAEGRDPVVETAAAWILSEKR
jgi:C-terminal processing protease CtpA/Prc